MKYKVGDKVRIVSKRTDKMNKLGQMDKYLGTIMTIDEIIHGAFTGEKAYAMNEDENEWCWYDDMIEGLVADEMSAVELLKWFSNHYCVAKDMRETFGYDYLFLDLYETFSPEEIIDRIQEFERHHAPQKMTVAEIEDQLGYRVEIVE